MTAAAIVPCPHCQTPLPGDVANTPRSVACPSCERLVQAWVFPALFRTRESGRLAEDILEAGTASCFFHEGKKAVIPCDGCGRFLCALCEVDLNGRHLCPSCVTGSRNATVPGGAGGEINLISRQAAYDTGALTVVLLSLLTLFLWPLWLFTAPLAIGLGVFSFFRPRSVTGRSRRQAVIAILVAVLQLAACALLLVHFAQLFRA